MPWAIDDKFKTDVNRDVVSFITRHGDLSAHDGVATRLTESARGLPDVDWYCPDVQCYAYFILHTRGNHIFGIAFGQRSLAYRVPQGKLAEALSDGGQPCPEIGDDWVLFDPWKTEGSESIRRWCKLAHDHAIAEMIGRGME